MQTSTPPLTASHPAARRDAHAPALYGEPMYEITPRELEPAGAQALLTELFEPGADRLARVPAGRRIRRARLRHRAAPARRRTLPAFARCSGRPDEPCRAPHGGDR